MRIKVSGTSPIANVVRGYLGHSGVILVDIDPDFEAEVIPWDRMAVGLDGVDSEIERLTLNYISDLTDREIVIQPRRRGNRSDRKIVVYVPQSPMDREMEGALEKGVYRALLKIAVPEPAYVVPAARDSQSADPPKQAARPWWKFWSTTLLLSALPLMGQTQNIGVATAGAPTFTEGQRVPVSLDLAGGLRTAGGGAAVTGTKSNNGGVPGSTNLGTLPGVATAGAPTYTEGNQVSLSLDLSGALRVAGAAGGGVAQTQVRNSGDTAWENVGPAAANAKVPIRLFDSGANPASVLNAAPSTEYGLVVRNIPSGTQTISGTVTANAGSGNFNILGTKSSNGGVAGSTNLGVLAAIATAAVPTYTEGNQASLSTDLSGRQRVTVELFPANQSFNLNQIVGNTVSTGNGISGTGVQRVTLASDSTGQVTLAAGTANIGDVDVLTFPDNEPFNVAQINGVAPSMGNGISGTGVQRVTIASDSTGQVAVASFPDNEPINVAQMNGVAVTMGNGVSGTGVQRVTLASDSTGQVAVASFPDNEPINVAQMNGVAVTMGNGTAGTGVQRNTIASDNSAIANWGHGATGSAVPVNATYMAGRGTGNLTGVIVCDNWTSINVTVDTTLITGTASQHIYICAIQMMAAGAVNAAIVSGTGTTCQTGTGAVFGGTTAATGWNFPANGGIAHGSGLGVVGRTAAVTDGICIDVSAAVQVSGNIAWTKF